jgi:hypothetical protein
MFKCIAIGLAPDFYCLKLPILFKGATVLPNLAMLFTAVIFGPKFIAVVASGEKPGLALFKSEK